MDKKVDIHKAGGVLIKDRKFLISRSKGKDFFVAPGGKLEKGETPEESLQRELKEEFTIEIELVDLEKFGTFYAPAIGMEDKYLQSDIFIVLRWKGEIRPDNEIEEIMWINSQLPEGIQLGSIFQHEVLPRLKREGMID
ncbi:MAG: NUDIX domain-containing protein [bacterium]|nr:NUDIX domain-containing protein [bacterium]